MAQGFGQYSGSKRVNQLKDKLSKYGYTRPDDIMMTIMEVFRDGEFVPDVGKYYTFIYSAKTKGVEYDDIQTINTIEDFYILVGEFAKNELENLESYEDA